MGTFRSFHTVNMPICVHKHAFTLLNNLGCYFRHQLLLLTYFLCTWSRIQNNIDLTLVEILILSTMLNCMNPGLQVWCCTCSDRVGLMNYPNVINNNYCWLRISVPWDVPDVWSLCSHQNGSLSLASSFPTQPTRGSLWSKPLPSPRWCPLMYSRESQITDPFAIWMALKQPFIVKLVVFVHFAAWFL